MPQARSHPEAAGGGSAPSDNFALFLQGIPPGKVRNLLAGNLAVRYDTCS